ncbi:hypothetical protein ANO11243_029810 [Dothideomycetidae sp. 11243]|nr:hypothetical protein ANO11243_029810 [fungal sp. No.11243]
MDPKYRMCDGRTRDGVTWQRIMRGNTQFIITVNHEGVRGTRVGDDFLRQFKASAEENQRNIQAIFDSWEAHGRYIRLPGGPPVPNAFDIIMDFCLPVLQRLAPSTSVQGLTLQDFVAAPTYLLNVVRANTGDDLTVKGVDQCSFAPTHSISPITLDSLPVLHTTQHVKASSVVIAPVDDEKKFRGPHGRVLLADGVHKRFKARLDARELEASFLRELRILDRIKQDGLDKRFRLCRLNSIVTTDDGSCIVGMLLDLMPGGTDLMDKQNWRPDMFAKWEEQVRTIVRELHANDIIWGSVNAGNVIIDAEQDAWVIGFGGITHAEFVDEDIMGTVDGDMQGLDRLFGRYLPTKAGLEERETTTGADV